MKNKNEVYVVVDTPKKAKKLKKVLDMFGERHSGEAIGQRYYDGVMFFGINWCAIDINREADDKTEVSIKELKNILAKEHLKEGDFVVAGINGGYDKWIVKFESFGDYGDFRGYYTDLQSSYELTSHAGSFDSFKRYATPEEIALLEPREEVIKNDDKFSELKEAHKNGAVIQAYSKLRDVWVERLNPKWLETIEYRIKPEENPNVVDVCKFWDKDDSFIIGIYKEHDGRYHRHTAEFGAFDNAKTITQQEAIDLLFNK